MAIVRFKCDTCSRTIEKQRDISGLEIIQRCTITSGCRGKLMLDVLLQDYSRASLTSKDDNLNDWVQRKVLFNHTQSIAQRIWTIHHNMGVIPTISAFIKQPDGDLVETIPQTTVNADGNTSTLTFISNVSGIAQLVSNQSSDALIVSEQDIIRNPVQLSNDGEITIATLDNSTHVTCELTFTTSFGAVLPITYSVDDQPDIKSPWADFANVNIQNKRYTVRSFNIKIPQIIDGTIANGSTVNITKLNNMPIRRGDFIILLSEPPFTVFDKNFNNYIDGRDTQPSNIIFDDKNMHINKDYYSDIYPPIRSS